MRSPCAFSMVGGTLSVPRSTSVATSLEVEGFKTIVPPFPWDSVNPCTAPSMTVIKMAVPKRSHQCRSMTPERPLRPSSSVPG